MEQVPNKRDKACEGKEKVNQRGKRMTRSECQVGRGGDGKEVSPSWDGQQNKISLQISGTTVQGHHVM